MYVGISHDRGTVTYIAPVPFMEVHGVLDTTVSYADNTAMTVYYFKIPWDSTKAPCRTWSIGQTSTAAAAQLRGDHGECRLRHSGVFRLHLKRRGEADEPFSSGHNPYLSGNPTNTQSTAILWDFMSQFALETIEDES